MTVNTKPILTLEDHENPIITPDDHTNPILNPEEQQWLLIHLQDCVHLDSQLKKQHFTTVASYPLAPSRRPAGGVIRYNEFMTTPPSNPSQTSRKAIAIDCEMVGVMGNRRELAFLVVVDLLTGEVLVNHFVHPTNTVRNWHTRWSGVTCADMKAAVRKGVAIKGWKAARAMLFEHMDSRTILVGHALHDDLNVLGIIHSTVIDTAILTADAMYKPLAKPFRRTWSLKTLANELIGYKIQRGKNGHSALEDTMATRSVLIYCTRSPLKLEAWADKARGEEPVQHEEPIQSDDSEW